MITSSSTKSAKCVASWGNHGLFVTDFGEQFPAEYLRRVGRPLCGDRVQATKNDKDQWHVTKIIERTNVFARADRKGRKQVIAANIDQLLIVIASQPAPSRDLLDRYLAAGELARCKSVILRNKVDINSVEDQYLNKRLEDYTRLGYQVLNISAIQAIGLEELRQSLDNHCSMLVGQSGVGKSSLVNALIPDLDLQTKAISNSTGKGTHTTSISHLYSLPGQNGQIIDSPGVWEYGLWQMQANDLAWSFCEFRAYLEQCRFRNCTHSNEPGCALVLMSESDAGFNRRYQCYLRLLNEQKRFSA